MSLSGLPLPTVDEIVCALQKATIAKYLSGMPFISAESNENANVGCPGKLLGSSRCSMIMS